MMVYIKSYPPWEETCEAIKRYLKYVHNLDICELKNDIELESDSVLIIPLFREKNNKIKSCLDEVKELREKHGFKFKVIFLVLKEEEIPNFIHPEKEMHNYAKEIIIEDFEDKAIFLAEIRYNGNCYRNIVPLLVKKKTENEKERFECLSERLEYLSNLLNNNEVEQESEEKALEKYYETFVKFYKDYEESKQKYNQELNQKLNQKYNLEELLSVIQKFYNELYGIKVIHQHSSELFRAPIPFPLQELLNAKQELLDKIKSEGKIKLLLVDNRWDKFIDDKKEKKEIYFPIFSLFENFGLSEVFEIEMIGNPEFYKNYNSIVLSSGNKVKIGKRTGESDEVKHIELDDEKIKLITAKGEEIEISKEVAFDFKEFRQNKNNYAKLVYKKIKNAHFVLLDFFLDSDDIYFAFDFIKDITEIKKKKQDLSTVWYFITSAMYDAVVKYAQSGLLTEYYELAVVNSGDDPLNEKREIIFIYKLLTFILARLKSFRSYWNTIEWFIEKCSNSKSRPEDKQCRECLFNIMNIARKFQIEWEEIKKIFPEAEYCKEENREIAEYVEKLIADFFWLPEADWRTVLLDIETVESKFGKKLSCKYINDEIRQRMERYY